MTPGTRLETLKQAEKLADDGRLDEAAALCDRVLSEDAEDAGALNLKGFCLASAGRYADALPLFKLARLYLPIYPPIRFNLAKALEKTGDAMGALAEYDEVLKLDSGDAGARIARGLLRQKSGDDVGARADFEELARRSPGNARAQALLGGCHLVAKRFKDAHDAFERALALDPSLKPEIDRLISGTVGADPPRP